MHEIERMLWNFLFAARRCAAADNGRASKAEADEIASRAVTDLSAFLRAHDAAAHGDSRRPAPRITVDPLV